MGKQVVLDEADQVSGYQIFDNFTEEGFSRIGYIQSSNAVPGTHVIYWHGNQKLDPSDRCSVEILAALREPKKPIVWAIPSGKEQESIDEEFYEIARSYAFCWADENNAEFQDRTERGKDPLEEVVKEAV
jgi:hypothetical protein